MFRYVKVLSNQTGDFVADVKSGKIPAGKDITLLPIMWIGSNDLLVGGWVFEIGLISACPMG